MLEVETMAHLIPGFLSGNPSFLNKITGSSMVVYSHKSSSWKHGCMTCVSVWPGTVMKYLVSSDLLLPDWRSRACSGFAFARVVLFSGPVGFRFKCLKGLT